MRTLIVGTAMTCAVVLSSAAPAGERPADLRARADAVRATAAEMRYTEIPWVTDLFEGFRLARDEKRPVFLYMITGDPLDDC